MTILFTADQHFGHANIIQYCDRPFDNVEEMDAELIRGWNEIVREGDTVWHLGDFTLGGIDQAQRYFSQLNGEVQMVSARFHHDKRWLDKDVSYWTKQGLRVRVFDPIMLISSPGVFIVLSHTPMARWYRAHYGAWHLFAHCHGRYQGRGLSLDVGVDSAHKLLGKYRPFSIEDVTRIMKKKGE